ASLLVSWTKFRSTGMAATHPGLDRTCPLPELRRRLRKRMAGQHFTPQIFFGLDPMVVSTAILCITYAAIIWDKLNRAIVALVGAAAAILIGALDQVEALKGIDWNTIGTLTGMMIIMSIAQRSGVFQYLAIWSAQCTRANPTALLVLLQLITAVVSA